MNNITVMIPAFNSGAYLDEAIQSALAAFQCSGQNVIVVDDGSRDNTGEVARRSGAQCIRHPSNRGIASALNTAIAAADTPYVAWLSSDDLYTEDAGSLINEAMRASPGGDFYFGSYNELTSSGAVSPVEIRYGLGAGFGGPVDTDWFVDLLFGCFINGSTTIIRRQLLVELGLFDGKYVYSQDYAMWLLMSYHRSSAYFIKQPVGLRRVHESQLSYKPAVRRAIIRENGSLLAHYLTPEILQRVDARLKALGGETDEYRIQLLKRLLHLGLYEHALQMLKSCDRVSAPVLRVMQDAASYYWRQVKQRFVPGA